MSISESILWSQFQRIFLLSDSFTFHFDRILISGSYGRVNSNPFETSQFGLAFRRIFFWLHWLRRIFFWIRYFKFSSLYFLSRINFETFHCVSSKAFDNVECDVRCYKSVVSSHGLKIILHFSSRTNFVMFHGVSNRAFDNLECDCVDIDWKNVSSRQFDNLECDIRCYKSGITV